MPLCLLLSVAPQRVVVLSLLPTLLLSLALSSWEATFCTAASFPMLIPQVQDWPLKLLAPPLLLLPLQPLPCLLPSLLICSPAFSPTPTPIR